MIASAATTLTTTFTVPGWIAEGFHNGTYERVGGVVRDVTSKKIVAWLRDYGISPIPHEIGRFSPVITPPMAIDPVTGVLNLLVSGANTVVTTKGFTKVDQRLTAIEQTLESMQSTIQLSSAVSILNLGVSAIGFAVIAKRITELEQRLQAAQGVLNQINRKIDLGFYAKFRAALDLASNAFSMSKQENRSSSALAAIDKFLEAEHIYTDYVDQELKAESQIADEYLLTLMLAYISEARCHLELGEPDIATERFQHGATVIRSRIQKYIEILLTSNPSVYLHPKLQDQIGLERLTQIYNWMDSSLDEITVFELQRSNLFRLDKELGKWAKSLPPAIVARSEVKGSVFGNDWEVRDEAMRRLPQIIEVMESMIETNQRFEAYELEVKAIAQLGLSFHEWAQLKPTEPAPEGANLMCIVPAEAIAV